jgi:cation diffusion facilitator family transporter
MVAIASENFALAQNRQTAADAGERRRSVIMQRKQAALISLAAGVVMLGVKTVAYLLTNSTAVLSDVLESIIHLGAISMALYSVIVSARPADESHPYGHGKVEFISAGIEGTLIVIAAVAIVLESVRALTVGTELQELNMGMLLILFASVINLFLGLFLVRRGKSTASLTLIADGKHILTDSVTSFGVIAGLAAVQLTGIESLDPIVAVLVAVNILVAGYRLVRTSVGGLMDESDGGTLARLLAIVREKKTPEWISVHHLRVMRSGDFHNVDFHLTIPFYWSLEHAHRFQHDVCRDIKASLDDRAHVLIHLDPCTREYCRLCAVHPCAERKEPCRQQLQWTLMELTGKPPLFDPDES